MHSVSHQLCINELHDVGKDVLYHLNLNRWLARYSNYTQESMSLLDDFYKLETYLEERKREGVIPDTFLVDVNEAFLAATWRLRETGNSYKLD